MIKRIKIFFKKITSFWYYYDCYDFMNYLGNAHTFRCTGTGSMCEEDCPFYGGD